MPYRPSQFRAPTALLLAALALLRPRPARAEDSASYLYQDYQEHGGRIGVQTSSAQFAQDLGTDFQVKLGGVTDTIVGATPTGQPALAGSDQVVLAELHDYRKAWNAEFDAQLPRVHLAAGFSRSLEYDYVSNGYSLNSLTDFNQKNTTLLLGVAATQNDVEVSFKPAWYQKHTADFIAGVTQLLDPNTSVTLDFTFDRSTGYLSEPYKLVQKDIQIIPGLLLPETFAENRPWTRDKGIVLLSLNRNFPKLNGAVEASYRYYADTYGIVAHTGELAWYQHVGSRLILRYGARIYQQQAADFYHYNLDDTSIVPVRIPTPQAPNYSSDARLSAFRTYDVGIKAVLTVTSRVQLEVSDEAYTQVGLDGVTPQSAYYQAGISSVGVTITW